MDQLVGLVGGYRERDKIIRVVQYVSRFLAGNQTTEWGRKLGTVGAELGRCRTVLRLFDDIPMLAYTLRYGTGAKETNTWLRVLELISNAANQLYYPFEHLVWLSDHKLIDRPADRWSVACLVAWGVSLATEMIKAIVRIKLIRRAQVRLSKETELEAQKERDSTENAKKLRGQLQSLRCQELDCYLAFVENFTDFINAIAWLPAGFLWSSKLSGKTTAVMGTISSLIKLYRIHGPKQKIT